MRNVIVLLLLLSGPTVFAQSYTGTYTIESPEGRIVLSLQQEATGLVQGLLRANGYDYAVKGGAEPPGISGTVTGMDGAMGFVAQHQGDLLYFKLFGYDAFTQPDYANAQTLVFARQDTEAPQAVSPEAPASSTEAVVINGTPLSPARVQALEQRYGTRVPAGNFWYDVNCGAWGVAGGPTLGFIMPGLDLPGPMPADISGGETNIFINGREIHPLDQQGLQQMLGVTYPGRYWLDAQGNLGVEGGMVLVNLLQVSQRATGSKGGLYSGMGGTVGVDGSGGVLFYSRNASGGYNSWSN